MVKFLYNLTAQYMEKTTDNLIGKTISPSDKSSSSTTTKLSQWIIHCANVLLHKTSLQNWISKIYYGFFAALSLCIIAQRHVIHHLVSHLRHDDRSERRVTSIELISRICVAKRTTGTHPKLLKNWVVTCNRMLCCTRERGRTHFFSPRSFHGSLLAQRE